MGSSLSEISHDWKASAVLSCFFGALVMLGYANILVFQLVTGFPVLFGEIKETMRKNTPETNADELRDLSALKNLLIAVAIVGLAILMHCVNYRRPDGGIDRPFSFYYLPSSCILVPYALYSARTYILIPTNMLTQSYCVVYDTVMKPYVRNNVMMMGFCAAGFFNTKYFSFLLLDIVNISGTMMDIIRSITYPLPQIGLVFYGLFVAIVIYGLLAMEYYADSLGYPGFDDDTVDYDTNCHSFVDCAILMFYYAVPDGSIGEVVDPSQEINDDAFVWRWFFDFSFFIFVGVFLFNIITGVMVDTFAELREEADKRSDIFANECFACGLTRSQYNDTGMIEPTFEQHKDIDHCKYQFVYFFDYLQTRDPTSFTGVESYVFKLLQEDDLAWIPARTSFAIQNKDIEVEESDLTTIVHTGISTLTQKMNDITNRLDEMQKNLP